MKIFFGGKASRKEFRAVERDVRVAAARWNADVCAVETFFGRGFEKQNSSATRREAPWKTAFGVDFFVLLRSFPGEFSPLDVEKLRRASPLAPIALIAGTLCEGENRTGATFPGTRRFYVGAWRELGRREFFRFFAESNGLFVAPALATRVDRLAASQEETKPKNGLDATLLIPPRRLFSSEKVAIFSDSDPELGAFLKEAFVERGADVRVGSIARIDEISEFAPSRIVVDSVDLASSAFVRDLRTIRTTFSNAPIDLLAFSPRVEELEFFENAENWGTLRVVSKPFDVEFLLNDPENRVVFPF